MLSHRRERRITDLLAYSPLLFLVIHVGCRAEQRSVPGGFEVVETSIAEIHAAMETGTLTARQLVELYLQRIEAYDKRGPALNAIIMVNPRALERAEELDAAFAESGFTGPLHGIPVIVKDNYDTHDMPTTAGSASLEGSIPPDDAFQVQRIREAGAIVLAKSNMAEFAFSPYVTIGSAIPGYTRNPYATNRVTAGSSGGTAAAVAASFGTVGLGTDTGNSIRGPSSHNNLFGMRSTMGLTSRDGIVPLNFARDIGGPIARTVADAVAVFDVIAGHDPDDPVTEGALDHEVERYADHLKADGLVGKRIGVVGQITDSETIHPGMLDRFNEALEAMRGAGAEIVDPVLIPILDERRELRFGCRRFKADLNAYLASVGPGAPVKTLQEIFDSDRFHGSVRSRIERSLDEVPLEENETCAEGERNSTLAREQISAVMAGERLDALVYPTWNNPPRLIGDLRSPHGDNSQFLSPTTGFPAFSVPMGYVAIEDVELPAGLQILGDAWSEPNLIEIAYAYEQATRHRRPPATTPPLR